MKKTLLILGVLFCAPLTASDDVKIRLFSTLEIKSATAADSGGQKQEAHAGQGAKELFSGRRGVYTVEAAGVRGSYQGKLSCETHNGFLHIFLETDIEYYTAQVLASEADDGLFNENYAEALAVVIRTYAFENRGRHGSYDMCDSTHCQKFRHKRNARDKWKKITAKSEGLILRCKGGKAAFFAACCGGFIATPESVWGGRNEEARPDNKGGGDFCSGYKYYTWVKRVDAHMADKALQKFYPGRKAEVFEISERSASGRARVFYFGGGLNVPAQEFQREIGRLFGWAAVPSLLFDIHPDTGGYILKGKGQGHGSGLCMAGASAMGKAGYKAEEILNHYFPYCTQEKISPNPLFQRGDRGVVKL